MGMPVATLRNALTDTRGQHLVPVVTLHNDRYKDHVRWESSEVLRAYKKDFRAGPC